MPRLKQNKWIQANRVRLVKQNGKHVLEIQRRIKARKNTRRRKR